MSLSRRQLLAGLGASGVLPSTSWAFGGATQVDIAELMLGTTLSRPNAWTRLLFEVRQTTSVEVQPRAVQLAASDPLLFEHPFAVVLGSEAFEMPGAVGIEQISRYLAYGGFLFFDETTGSESSGFDRSVRKLVRTLFPTRPLSPLPSDHSLYRSFFLLRRPYGRLDRYRVLEGVVVGNLCPLVYCRNDLSGALDRGDDGRAKSACIPGGESQRREALKLGINLIMYSLTANYKKDQAHVRQLLLEGRLE